mmetsp:Transcript_19479/g.42224  ORF Transcript_19479/g.42224 Transcript_19479/m.42224 type:complete len:85 (+) Transcript_19479:88-342(+)|eukprot:CAMPEP_0202890076 /NCGR_PEP_ID=MMETSP1392-20130828/593_1 /ASSEMBLY_ACC=CAM_ASM_000868 /TAXON_ID=225041 /ORGANISM="Chlamydomonas chlamydogama, Strain SAG 11-48b" /LENGTH=84 /DNA_ID=CAMNT_0049573567 /DNA_START=94 /DNA_END=348 /DNA_ORIENTATION=-
MASETAAPEKAAGQDTVLVLVLLAIMVLFLLRNIAKFRSEGMAVSRTKGGAGKAKESDEEDEEDEEEEEEDLAEGDEDEDDKTK